MGEKGQSLLSFSLYNLQRLILQFEYAHQSCYQPLFKPFSKFQLIDQLLIKTANTQSAFEFNCELPILQKKILSIKLSILSYSNYTLSNKTFIFLTTIFMQVHPHYQQKLSPFSQSAPKRSLSYNDLKRKRLIRSQKSKTKLQPQQSQKLILKTEKKKPSDTFPITLSSAPNTAQDIRKIQKSISQLKDVFDQIKQKAKIKKYMISKPFYTDRVRANNQEQQKIAFVNQPTTTGNRKVSLFYESVEMAGNQKKLIKEIISKKKSQRRLLKFDEIRAEVKRSKSKSKFQIGQEETAPHSKIINQSSSQEVMQGSRSRKNIHVNKFETVQERPFIKYSQSKDNNKELQVKNYVASNLSNKEALELGENSQYRSRRKLKIDDFKTQRKDIQITKDGQKSQGKLKFYRRLKKTNSEIVIKTSQITYNKSKYMTRVESKSTINVNLVSQRQQNPNKNKSLIVLKSTKKQQTPAAINQKQNQFIEQKLKQSHSIVKQQNDDQINLLKDLELSAINISEIQIKKEQSFTEIQNDISLVNAIEAQQLQLKMKQSKQKPSLKSPQQTDSNSKQTKQNFKKSKKQTPHKSTLAKPQNAENIQNLSNILDFISLPTEELKVKINRCSTKIVKKKNEMEKFKKIFPANFFNK